MIRRSAGGRDRGALLLELLVALGVLAMAATVLLATFSDMSAAVARDGIVARAADLARTRMSELEAGLISIEELRAESTRQGLDAARRGGASASASATQEEFSIDATIERTEFPGLSLVEIRVMEPASERTRFVLRQLVALPEWRARESSIGEELR